MNQNTSASASNNNSNNHESHSHNHHIRRAMLSTSDLLHNEPARGDDVTELVREIKRRVIFSLFIIFAHLFSSVSSPIFF